MGLILLACLPVCVFADTRELSGGDEAGISLSAIVPPSVVSGTGAAYTKGGAAGLTFTTDDAKDNLLRVLVDGKVVSPENYTVSGDPLAITLHPDFLDTLSAGEHTIEIVTTNGTATARITVKSATVPGSPATGDNCSIGLWIALMCLSGLGLAALAIMGKKQTDMET